MEVQDSNGASEEAISDDDVQETTRADPTKKKRSLTSKQRQRILKAKRIKRKEIFKPPTRDELNALEEYEASVQSSLLRLQIEELLTEVKLKEKTKEDVLKWFADFKKELSSFSESPRYDLSDISWNLDFDIQTPLKLDLSKPKGMFQFCSPETIELIGSFPLALALNAEFEVDILITLPKKFFQHDDYKNYRYHWKRALYVTYLASLLQKSNLAGEMSFEYLHSDILKPTLIVSPKGKLRKQVVVKIHISAPVNYFQPSQLMPTRANIKTNESGTTPPNTEAVTRAGTPHYNNSILVDCLSLHNQKYLVDNFGTSQGVRDGIILLKVWLYQRYLHKCNCNNNDYQYGASPVDDFVDNEGFGAMNNFILTMFVAYLFQTKKLNQSMSSYQIARNVWMCLSQSDWTVNPISCCQQPKQQEVLHDLSSASVVFMDSTGYLNICANMEASTFFRVKHEAEEALKLIETTRNFDALFMTPMPFLRSFDHIVRIKNVDFANLDSKHLKNQGGNIDEHCIVSSLTNILLKGLGKRVTLLATDLKIYPKWAVTDPPPYIDHREVKFGLLLDLEQSTSILDKGPAADVPEAAEFRNFWGSKAELRRFQDGSICEAVVWEGECLAEKRLVCEQVTRYILKKHVGVNDIDVQYVGGQLDALLSFPYLSWPSDWAPYGTGEEMFLLLHRSFDSLGNQLRSLQGLPLTITSVQGIAPSFRYTEVFPPVPTKIDYADKLVEPQDSRFVPSTNSFVCPKWIPYLEVLIYMEGSGKWPDDAEAVLRIKAAFHLQLFEQLREQCRLTTVMYGNHVDVFKDGYVFRLKVTYKKEVTLLKMEYTSDGMLRLRDNDVASVLERQTVQLPKLTSILHGLQLHQSSFSSACRLAKRWVFSQLLSDHVPDIAIELIVAHLFISPGPFTHPRSPQVALQRFLYLLSNHDWKTTPLIVNLNHELTKEEIKEIQSKFSSMRSTLPLMFIATPHDKFSSMWTKAAPLAPVVHRMAQLATAALVTLETELLQSNGDVKSIFRPSLMPYDVIIRLRPLQIPLRNLAVDVDPKTKLLGIIPYEKRTQEKFPVVGYNPVHCYVRELKEAYDEFAAFFYDVLGGEFIAVLWKPDAFQPLPLTASHINCRVVRDSGLENFTVPDVEAILEDFAVIGRGLVKSIETKTDKWLID